MDVFITDSDTDEYTETSDSEYQDERESVFGGQAQSILSRLDESIVKIDDFLSFERGFTHGDIVSSIADPSGQLGKVVDLHVRVDLETRAGDVIRDVDSKNLSRVRPFTPGDYVISGPWIGRITRVFDMVTVLFNDGSKEEILVRDLDTVRPVLPVPYEENPYFYYTGQRVRVKDHATVSKTARWLCGEWRVNGGAHEGTVCRAEAGLVHVYWLVSATRVPAPPSLQEPKHLVPLSCFPHASWQLGDRCMVLDAPTGRVRMVKGSGPCGKESIESYLVAKTKTTVDVLWQNGDISVGLDPQMLSPVSDLGDHDFWPGQFVMEKVITSELEGFVAKCPRVGVVRRVDALERTVRVKWVDVGVKRENGFTGDSEEETVSAYELIEHPDFSYCVREIVVRSINFNNIEKVEESGFEYLSCFGNVLGYKDDAIEVKWANGIVSKVQPFEICGLEKLIELASPQSANDGSMNPEISRINSAEQESQICHENAKKIKDESSEDCIESLKKATALLFPKSALDFLTTVTAGLFSSTSSCSVKEDPNYQIVKESEPQHDVNETTQEEFHIKKNEPVEPEKKTGREVNRDLDPPKENLKLIGFKQFDVIDECSDHHFINENTASQVKKGWVKKIQQEWSILEKDLPESIYVRVYEERMDLLRACIVGANGTPYHDGLFFFDIFFPPNYPHEPPSVHYHSGGLRLNPNLYESGKVCLSLLKTWSGTGNEVWDPESSTVLQVLLSLQALVLNEKPYFNEAGFDKQIGRAEGEKNSVTYNENAFLLSCKSMMYLLHKPPKHFEKLVEDHFTCRAPHILKACNAYLNGAQIGHAFINNETQNISKDECNNNKGCSTGFKLMLSKLLPKLVSAFSDMGIDCNHFN